MYVAKFIVLALSRLSRAHSGSLPSAPEASLRIPSSALEHVGGLPRGGGRLCRLFNQKQIIVSYVPHAKQLKFLIVTVLALLGHFHCQILEQIASNKRGKFRRWRVVLN